MNTTEAALEYAIDRVHALTRGTPPAPASPWRDRHASHGKPAIALVVQTGVALRKLTCPCGAVKYEAATS
jgi:hypothetical protein